MEILWRLVLAHLLADFTFQTNYIAQWKRRNIIGSFVHTLVFLACSIVLCYPYLGAEWSYGLTGWGTLILLFFFHLLEDEWRVRAIKKVASQDSVLFFLWDQLVHLGLIFVFFPGQVSVPTEKWVLLAILFVLVTHFTSVLLYFIQKEFSGVSAILQDGKYPLMIERVLIGAAMLLPGYAAFSCILILLARAALPALRNDLKTSGFAIIGGNTLALVFGFMARMVYYSKNIL